MKKIISITVLVSFIIGNYVFAQEVKQNITKDQAIEIAKQTYSQFLSTKAKTLDLTETEITAELRPVGKYNNWLPRAEVYQSPDFKGEGLKAIAEKMNQDADKADENGHGYWEVFFKSTKRSYGGVVVQVDLQSGKSSGPMYLR